MKKLNQILLIDDDKTNNFLNEQLLHELAIAHHVEVLVNGQQGVDYLRTQCLETARQSCPALVIFDHHMPKDLIRSVWMD